MNIQKWFVVLGLTVYAQFSFGYGSPWLHLNLTDKGMYQSQALATSSEPATEKFAIGKSTPVPGSEVKQGNFPLGVQISRKDKIVGVAVGGVGGFDPWSRGVSQGNTYALVFPNGRYYMAGIARQPDTGCLILAVWDGQLFLVEGIKNMYTAYNTLPNGQPDTSIFYTVLRNVDSADTVATLLGGGDPTVNRMEEDHYRGIRGARKGIRNILEVNVARYRAANMMCGSQDPAEVDQIVAGWKILADVLYDQMKNKGKAE